MKPLIRNFFPGKDSLNTFDCGKPDLNNFLLETGHSFHGTEQNTVPDFRADGGRYEGRWCRW